MLNKLTIEFFEALLNERFHLALTEDTAVRIELIEVCTLLSHLDSLPSWRQTSDLRPSPFAIVFRGPLQPILSQGMYMLSNDGKIRIENLFLVPIDADSNGRYYEAVFN